VVIDPYGVQIARCEDGEQIEATVDIDMQVLEAFREKFPVLNDADV
jgi:predicted amidohydrolase